MKQRVITGVIFSIVVAAFVIPAYFAPVCSLLLALIVGSVSGYEMIKALKAGGFKPLTPFIFLGGIVALLSILLTYLLKESFIFASAIYLFSELVLCMIAAIIPAILNRSQKPLEDGIATACTMVYITFPLFCLVTSVFFVENGWFYMIPALTAPWVSDVFAYFCGVMFGKNKIVPHISPKKTWEGSIGGAICCALVVVIYSDLFIYKLDNIQTNIVCFSLIMFVLGIIISIMSQFGDWFASVIKRFVGIKDYGKFMPGHGGMLDRFDSAFFTLPLSLILALVASFLH